jgi:hypothetical protein
MRDESAYELREQRVAEDLVAAIRTSLEEAGIRGHKLRELTEELAYAVTAIVDGAAHIDFDDAHLVPVLGFAEGRMRDRLLLREGGSQMHEYVPGIIEGTFRPRRVTIAADQPVAESAGSRGRSRKSPPNPALKRRRRKRRVA